MKIIIRLLALVWIVLSLIVSLIYVGSGNTLRMLKRWRALGLDDNAALIIDGDQFRVITSQPEAWAYRTFWRNQAYHEEKLPTCEDLRLFREKEFSV